MTKRGEKKPNDKERSGQKPADIERSKITLLTKRRVKKTPDKERKKKLC